MFSFFTRKEYLVDHLNGFIDIHNHILPGLDDGAKNVEESIELIKGFGEFGVNKFICTPHIMHNYYDNTPKTIKKSYKILKKELEKGNFGVTDLNYAAEYMIDDNFENILATNKILTLKSNYLLVEMSYLQPSINFNDSIKKITEKQIYPVFAHPERYIYLQKNFANFFKLKNKGIQFQLNMLSLSQYYGKEIQKTAFKLLENDMYDFIASDVHNLRHLHFLKNQLKIRNKHLDKILNLINNTIKTFV